MVCLWKRIEMFPWQHYFCTPVFLIIFDFPVLIEDNIHLSILDSLTSVAYDFDYLESV